MPFKRDPLAWLLAEPGAKSEAFDADLWAGGAPDPLRLIPVPARDCPVPATEPRPGCFYKIQYGGGGLLTTTGRAYDVRPGNRRLELAGIINDHPYNRRFWVRGVWPFEDGQISFNPRFVSGFTAQARSLGEPPQSPPGTSFAILWIPPLTQPTTLDITGNCTEPLIRYYWFAAARNAFDAWQRLVNLAALPSEIDRRNAWNNGQEIVWFGRYSSALLRTVLARMDRIENVFRRPQFTLRCDPDKPGFAWSLPGIYKISLRKSWLANNPPNVLERIQTFIHEAYHIAGIPVVGERRKYGLHCAKCQAESSIGHRNAENFGYYAMSQSILAPLRVCAFTYRGDSSRTCP